MLTSEGDYNCVSGPGGGGGTGQCYLDEGDGGVPVGCGKLFMCWFNYCSCSETECEAGDGGNIAVDATLSGDSLEGTLDLGRGVTIRLSRH